ncbi:VMA21-like domain [Plasmodiophora brassicae]|uniref:Uncharacterized protein n=1 Tax=Plasmodiophora brassicae TaxID=37360 RepID=A0A3P3YAE9_PLABS|nr:unnamed protein product [Plasmodiophora brassicae]
MVTLADVVFAPENASCIHKAVVAGVAVIVIPILVFFASHSLLLPLLGVANRDSNLMYSGFIAVVAVKGVTTAYMLSVFSEPESERREKRE